MVFINTLLPRRFIFLWDEDSCRWQVGCSACVPWACDDVRSVVIANLDSMSCINCDL